MRNGKGSIFGKLVAVAILLAPGIGHAELQRVEAVGIYGIRDALRSKVIPRDEAISRARWEGVSRVALELIGESAPSEAAASLRGGEPKIGRAPRSGESRKGRGPSDEGDPVAEPSHDEAAALRKALGNDILPYMRSYRILDDRGEVPALFNDEPSVTLEYVVVVEVLVDVDRVTRALESAGLIAATTAADPAEVVVVELVGLSRYEALQIFLDALRTEFGATRVTTLEFSRQRQTLRVEGPLDPSALSSGLARYENPRLVLEPTGIDLAGRRIRLVGRWVPEKAAEGVAPAVEPGPDGRLKR